MRAEVEGLAAAAVREREERLSELTDELALRRRAAEAEGEKEAAARTALGEQVEQARVALEGAEGERARTGATLDAVQAEVDEMQGAKEGEGFEQWFEARKREWDLSGPFGLEKDLADARDAVAVAERALASRMAEQAAADYTEAFAALRTAQEEAQARRQTELSEREVALEAAGGELDAAASSKLLPLNPILTLTLNLTLPLTLPLPLPLTLPLTLTTPTPTLTLTRRVASGRRSRPPCSRRSKASSSGRRRCGRGWRRARRS